MVADDGSWKFDFFRPWVPEEIINKTVSVPPPYPSSSSDRILWGTTSTGSFSLKNAYEKVREGTFNLKERLWEIPWKYQGPHQIRFFIWLALKQSLFTNAERVIRGFGSSNACSLYGYDYEDVLHILRYCNAYKDGLVRFDEGFAVDDGCVRDHNGEWIIGFAKYLGNCTF
ncbi:hypothetical protein PVK06_013382 [Gossypium arboreum]|uniref:Reverse transcriptase zinc-binding domain-containing protein n=1 Tax=Gossypium arboreum TaxID=29729 RepID=A0ABR0QEX0_GOSAR|nr:hypothetical protein PVK06_013382 [Gossypium arboreum]